MSMLNEQMKSDKGNGQFVSTAETAEKMAKDWEKGEQLEVDLLKAIHNPVKDIK